MGRLMVAGISIVDETECKCLSVLSLLNIMLRKRRGGTERYGGHSP